MMRLLALLLALSLQAEPPQVQSKPTAIRGAKVYTGTAVLESATILIEGGRITAVGKDVTVPPDAKVIDATGKVVLPGLIDAASRLFLDPGERGAGSAEHTVLDALDFYQDAYKEAVEQGVTAVYVTPTSFGPVNGLGAVLHLDPPRTVLVPEASLKLTLGVSGGDTSTAAQRYEGYQQLKQTFDGVKQYIETFEKYKKELAEYEQKKKDPAKKEEPKEPAKPKSDRRNDILARALDAKQPLTVRIEAHTPDALTLALRLAEEYKLRAVLEQATEAEPVAAAIAKARIPVVAGPVFRYGPGTVDTMNHSIACAAALVKAGVPVAIGTFSDERAGHVGPGATRFLMESAAFAASKGLTREQAVAAITIAPARILGVEKLMGSLEKGKFADLVVLSGEPFEAATFVERTVIRGETAYRRGEE